MATVLECQGLTKSFDGQRILSDLSLRVEAGQFVALLGPSGCGKTTTLRLIAGFETPDAGTITVQGRRVADAAKNLPPEQRNIGMVFQEYALFPHLTVADNISFGLRTSRDEKKGRVGELLELVGLTGLAGRMPHALSGGQQQRVALARALAPSPAILLLDEPFSNLDAALRTQVRMEVHGILSAAGVTSVFVTHDQEEALSLGDQVAVMFDGRIAQIGTPQHIYTRPATAQVAAFVGEANFLPGTAEGGRASSELGPVALVEDASGPVDLLIRPESLTLDAPENGLTATVTQVEFFGHDQRIGIRLASGTALVVRTDAWQRVRPGDPVGVRVAHPAQAFRRPAPA